jgi:hypothetical protein
LKTHIIQHFALFDQKKKKTHAEVKQQTRLNLRGQNGIKEFIQYEFNIEE